MSQIYGETSKFTLYCLKPSRKNQNDRWFSKPLSFLLLRGDVFVFLQVLGLYFVARLIVAVYIFLSAYGHYTYSLKRGASSWSRVAEVLFRLNLYTVLLCLTMDVPYLHYYFVPLISACYLLVLLVAAIPPVGEYNLTLSSKL